MRIKEEDLKWLAARGISVRFYPESITLDEWIERKWQQRFNEEYQHLQKAQADSIADGWSHVYFEKSILEMTDADLREKAKDCADVGIRSAKRYDGYSGAWYDSQEFFIEYASGKIIKRSCRKSEVITRERVLDLIEKEERLYRGAYGDFTLRLREFMKKHHLDGDFNIYPTQYGIGVWVFYNWHCEECIDKVRRVLDSLGIEYQNEFSDARWIYRFKISKKEVNRAKVG